MKQIVVTSIFLLVTAGSTLQSVGPARANVNGLQDTAALRRVSYQGVTFAFDPSLASEVRPETISASTEGKPSDIWPEHLGFSLVGYPRPRSLPENDPHIRVFSVPKFREAFAIATKEYVKSLAQPSTTADWAADFDSEIKDLKSLLASKPGKANLPRFLTKLRHDPGCGPTMPFLPMWEACQAFFARPRYITFRNGEGVLFLTQMNVSETSQVTNQGLEYAFQGITNDGASYVYAEFSVAAPFLPKGDEPTVQAWNQKNYLLSHKSPQYQKYVRPIVAKLEALPSDQFKPNLTLLEALISSMKAQTK